LAESLASKFSAFLNRASDFRSLSVKPGISGKVNGHQVILLEDLPNLQHEKTFASFQTAISRHIESSDTPVVLIMSETGVRGQQRDEEGWQSRQSTVVDARHILPLDLLQGPYVTRIE
jgi:cell cycle checkpoint protein